MYWLEQLRICWPSSRPPARLDDWPTTDTWSVRHVSQCLSITRIPVLVDPCQMLFWGLKKRGGKVKVGKRQKESSSVRITDQKGSARTSRPSKE